MTEGRSPSAAVAPGPPAPQEAPREAPRLEPRLPSLMPVLVVLCLRTTVSRGCAGDHAN